jgi:anti-anti-sigma regulatory factor
MSLLWEGREDLMLKISTVDTGGKRRVVVEGKLTGPWAGELRKACDEARADLGSRVLIVDLKSVIALNAEGEEVLLQLMRDGFGIRSRGVFITESVRQLRRKLAAAVRRNGDG